MAGQMASGSRTAAPVERLRRTAWRLGAALLGSAPDGNQVASPAGLLAGLAMLRAGAGSGTAAELDAVLGFPLEHRDEAMGALLAQWAEYDGDPACAGADQPPQRPVLHLANAIFAARGLPVGTGFLETLAAHFGCQVRQVEFGTPAARAALDGWVREHSGGRIGQAPLELDAGTSLSLLNVLTFAAAWAEPFEPAEDADPFTLADGTKASVPMMFGLRTLSYAAGPGWRAVELPYTEGFLMRLVLPARGRPVFDAAQLAEIEDRLAAAPAVLVALGLPKWEHQCSLDLMPVLAGLGLAETFGPRPDFEAIHEDAEIASAAQAVNITVAEEGTVAAAVTQFAMICGSPPGPEVELVFDRPFLYQIIHEGTGMPLFLGTVMDPRG
ncbi:serpin family protein [Arthrobacter sp. I2-34]|uniref:Serpin family protein n=1 Tax=Arthrobacter hankyongi TaxID=2904801 RepID=A0ABS9L1F2_9MICC|nr:serpin family protein [Arthrobacter hankyongi]MCG2620476.1 serpin family protein [Arthrobacter hankyongi]